ncbi:tRNA (5-methylaminomethyl-2-thiouridine)(34)-methyltransferase MnmD [Marivita hallyeonensis]|uniref:tRNA U34 5-methylaminomethyl-2-thiouridine-forming methyltransferase MnmC n=1 Tax=Marivita hallyeonensis TaxID=996342 RepID=A0A1M5TGH4_9RHOB|nr:tRNA (5-methylaminomethyl-2-thiouridine)(34)-methyltransferase MnmD [Marivita hallyeonensis]SHH49857.1 tRNA U34 5-methylaminomethyl-2-thiouridine-forming methyltransferase MnmC [Marivita hallyeonensis]
MNHQSEPVEWRDRDVPVSRRFDDPYFSLDNGLAETRYVFLRGNDLPARFRDGLHIAELGFGTGLNLLATMHLWRASGQTGTLHFTSFEAFPMTPDDMIRAQQAFPELSAIAAELAPYWLAQAGTIALPGLSFTLIEGDARETVKHLTRPVDAWYLDGFSPAKNPELWDPDLLAHVSAKATENGTAATYTAAGHVRRALDAAGFTTERIPGFGRKRHMTIARKTSA